MIRDITIGQYYPVESVVHRLDPRTKLFGTLIYIISLFFADNLLCYAVATVFLAMAVGLATGMGFLGLAVLFTAIIAVVNVVYVLSPLGRPREAEKTLKIVVPEDLEFDGIFDDALDRFAAEHELTEVTTSNMGSLYTLEYTLRLREPGMEKRLIDEVRCLNGNLKVTLGKCELKPQGVL